MNEKNALQVNEQNNALTQWESEESLQRRIKKMLQIQQKVMKKDVDYGIIPGCEKPSLYKPGAELLMVTFKISDRPDVEDLSEDGEIRYRVRTDIYSIATGIYLGYGIGECSTNEDKYKWRYAVCQAEYDETDESMRRKKWYKNGKHSLQIRSNPSDLGNTVLKMAKKRSKIDGVLSVLAASRVYTQDIEDMSKEYQDMIKDEKRPQSAKPDITQETKEAEAEFYVSKNGTKRQKPPDSWIEPRKLISEKQGYLILAKLSKAKISESALLNFLQLPSVFYITWNKNSKVCMEKLLETIEKKPEFFKKYEPKQEKNEPEKEKVPEVQGDDDFLDILRGVAFSAGCVNDDEINQKLMLNFPHIKSMDRIPADSQSSVIDYFNHLRENPEQA